MVEVTLELTPQPIHLDVCRACRFLWCDHNELEQIPLKPPPEPTLDERLHPKAKELLALKKVAEIREQDIDDKPEEVWQYLPALLGMPVEKGGKLSYTRPWITWIMATACVFAAIVSWTNLENVIKQFGLIPYDIMRYGGVTFFTSFFLHGGIWHLIGNVYFLLVFGDNVEAALGRFNYLILLFGATLTGGLLHFWFDPYSTVPLIGASGGISGVIVFYALMFPKAQLGFLASISYVWFRWLALPAWSALIGWVILQIFGVYKQLEGFSNVSSLAHLGGGAVGLAFWGWTRLRLARFDWKAKRVSPH